MLHYQGSMKTNNQTNTDAFRTLAIASAKKGNSVAILSKYQHSHLNAWGTYTPCMPMYPRSVRGTSW